MTLSRRQLPLVAAAVLLPAMEARAQGLDKLRVGKAVAVDWAFLPLDVGRKAGIYRKHGIDLDIISFAGDAKLIQGLNAGSIDIGLASGPDMAFSVKGADALAVAALDGAPRNFAVVVGPDSPLRTVADLKGRTLAVTTTGSLTEWLAKRIALKEGWGADGIRTVALGAPTAEIAALRTHQVDGVVVVTQLGYVLEAKKQGRILTTLESFAPHFHAHVIEARRELIAKNPDLVKRFLQALFASIAWMKAHRAETGEIAQQVLGESAAVVDRTYDNEIGSFVPDGSFDPQAIATLKESFIATGMLDKAPPDSELFTTRFVPVRP